MSEVVWWKPLFNFGYLKQKLLINFKVLLILLHIIALQFYLHHTRHKTRSGLGSLKSYDCGWSTFSIHHTFMLVAKEDIGPFTTKS